MDASLRSYYDIISIINRKNERGRFVLRIDFCEAYIYHRGSRNRARSIRRKTIYPRKGRSLADRISIYDQLVLERVPRLASVYINPNISKIISNPPFFPPSTLDPLIIRLDWRESELGRVSTKRILFSTPALRSEFKNSVTQQCEGIEGSIKLTKFPAERILKETEKRPESCKKKETE